MAEKTHRDGLAWTCFLIHIAVLAIAVTGWMIPGRHWLGFYLLFLPSMVLHWKLNRDTCILNSLENWLRHRRWRAPETNREEGAWLRTLLADATGLLLSPVQMNAVIYSAVAVFWLLGLAHILGKF